MNKTNIAFIEISEGVDASVRPESRLPRRSTQHSQVRHFLASPMQYGTEQPDVPASIDSLTSGFLIVLDHSVIGSSGTIKLGELKVNVA